MEHKAHVSEAKKKVVANLTKLMEENPIIGIVNMESLPGPQLQSMRSQLRESATLIMTKKRLVKIAIKQLSDKKKGIIELEKYLIGMPAVLFTKDNPFKLSKILQKSKSKAPAKAGQTAPNDIVVTAGPTPFAPGPIIGELAVLGIKSGVEDGKVVIKEDSVVAKTGDKISGEIAGVLTRLGIEPMEVGLDLIAVYEDGTIYQKDILSIDEQEYLDRLDNAARWAFNLAFESGYPTKETVELLIGKAFRETKAVGTEAKVFEKGIVEDLVGKAEREMFSVKSNVPDSVKEEPKAEEKVEEKVEEKPVEEAKVEEGSKPEEKTEEVKPEEPKVEEKPAEVKVEEKSVEKVEESKPAEEVKPEEPKVEEKVEEPKPVEEVKPEVKKESESQQFKPTDEARKLQEQKEAVEAPSKEELEENIKDRDKKKELDEVEEIAKGIARKHALGK